MKKVDIKSYIKQVVPILAKKMNIKEDSFCFCGSGKKYSDCCLQKSDDELSCYENIFDNAVKYRYSQGGTITGIPLGIFQQFEKKSSERLTCLYPDCHDKPISCHLIPKNILKACFGNHCKEFKLQDDILGEQLIKIGINDAGALSVFCPKHDNSLFSEIDTLKINFSCKKQLFLLAFKAISFSLRKTQCLLGIDSQVELFRPKLILENPNSTIQKGTNVEIDISRLHEQYLRFNTAYSVFIKAEEAFRRQNWDFFSYFHSSIDYPNSIFFAGFINLSHDLENVRINTPEIPINMTCNLFTTENKLHALFSCPDGASKISYAKFLEQLQNVDEKTFFIVINNILTASSYKPLLPENFSISEEGMSRIKSLQIYAKNCMKCDQEQKFDLKNEDHMVKFIYK